MLMFERLICFDFSRRRQVAERRGDEDQRRPTLVERRGAKIGVRQDRAAKTRPTWVQGPRRGTGDFYSLGFDTVQRLLLLFD